MRYRALSADGDYTFGQGSKNFLVNSAAAAGQAVLTRLRLMKREWFLDNTEGTPYSDEILGTGTKALYDQCPGRSRECDQEDFELFQHRC
jgi:hypothetical protein